jgi:uncharacterized protein (UPF0218 family)
LIRKYKNENTKATLEEIARVFSVVFNKRIARRTMGDILSDQAITSGIITKKCKKIKRAKYPDIEKSLFMWIVQITANNGVITEDIIKNKAKNLLKCLQTLNLNHIVDGFQDLKVVMGCHGNKFLVKLEVMIVML